MASKRNTLEDRLRKEKERIGKIALRSPRTWKEVEDRNHWERLNRIIRKRYENI